MAASMCERKTRRAIAALGVVVLAFFLAAPVMAAPPIRHVFLIVLENKNFDATFGPATRAPYLGHELASKGALLTQYYAIGHLSLGNYIAMISGQPPTPATQRDCRVFTDFSQTAPPDENGVVAGTGCVYPASVKTIADQLEARGLTWRGYMEDMGTNPAREAAVCAHPALGSPGIIAATPGDNYTYRHNPFIYFHSIIDRQADCAAHNVNLDRLKSDLASISTTPNFSFIVPNVCDDGHDNPCADGRAGGLAAIDPFLKLWVPRILTSPAFKKDGLLIITFDESGGDATACCDEPTGPNTDKPGLGGPGGGRIGAVMLSPFIKAGTVSDAPRNHYDLLRGIEDLFGLAPLGYAHEAKGFPAIFSKP
jgi:phospholipase C